jgi:protoporphyrinogen oxidase
MMNMKVGIVGCGFAGLAAGYYLSKKGHQVELFERDNYPGGLAIGYKEPEWEWTLEQHYHHWFTNDKSVLDLANEIGHEVIIRRPKTSNFVQGGIYQLDSPLSLLKFPKLSVVDRLRMGLSVALLRYNRFWKPLEMFRAEPYLKASMGKKAYELLWEPLMKNKLGKYYQDVSLAWFWARVYKRTPSLAYPEGGFLNFANHLQKVIENRGGKFAYNTEVVKIMGGNNPSISIKKINQDRAKEINFDSIVVTLPSFLFTKIADSLPQEYTEKMNNLKGIGAVNLILRLKSQFMTDGTYWLSMSDPKSDILAIVEHTNFMDKKHYNDEHIVYLGNYMERSDKRFSMEPNELLKLYDPWLSKINPGYKSGLIGYKVFKAPFAQPIITPHYSGKIPSFKTPLENVYLANIEQVYPWDRGTNYAVELGRKTAEAIS